MAKPRKASSKIVKIKKSAIKTREEVKDSGVDVDAVERDAEVAADTKAEIVDDTKAPILDEAKDVAAEPKDPEETEETETETEESSDAENVEAPLYKLSVSVNGQVYEVITGSVKNSLLDMRQAIGMIKTKVIIRVSHDGSDNKKVFEKMLFSAVAKRIFLNPISALIFEKESRLVLGPR
jgi:hypothetical protein